ncbi:MAG: CotH kinase family protein [Verrucomicrobiota bacterium]
MLMFTSFRRLAVIVGLALLGTGPAPAAQLLYEGFNGAVGSGNLPGQAGGTGWNGAWQAIGGNADVLAGSMAAGASAPAGYDGFSSGQKCFLPNGSRVARNLDTSVGGPFEVAGYRNTSGRIGATGKTLYISFLQQPNGTTNFYEFEFHRDNLGDPGRIGGIGNDAGDTHVNLRAPNGTQTFIAPGNTSVNFYVVRIDFKSGSDDVRVYMNPTSDIEPETPTLTRLAAADMSFNGISFGAYLNGRTVMHDEIRMGQTWADVVPAPPVTTPIVGNLSTSNIAGSAATISGSVTRTGSDVPNVTIYYGTTDAGNVAANWQHSLNLGAQSGAFSVPISGLQPYTRYYYSAFAQNSSGGNWATAALDFATIAALPVMENLPATELSIATARIGANVVSTGGRVPVVTLYHGPADGGTNPAAWQHAVDLGAVGTTANKVIGGLLPNATYYFRVFGVNEGGGAWAPATATFTTPVAALPNVENRPASQINGYSASLNGHLNSTGNAPTTVTIFHGPVNGGTTAGAWARSVEVGLQSKDFTAIVSGLTTTTSYFFRARAQNAAGTAWATSSSTFTTTGFTPTTVYLNEFCVSTNSDDPHPYLDADGDAEDWIELYNPTASAADIGGYYLTDNASQLTKWRFPLPTIIPANGYLVVFASSKNRAVSGQQLHTNFKLAEAGEYLALVQPNGTTVVKGFSPAFPVVPEYWSYGLTLPSSGGNYLPYQIPTPGAANTTAAGTPAGAVNFSIPSKAFAETSVSLTLSTASATAVIRYTTDRSEPTVSSTAYSGPLTINTTTQIRARAFESGAGFAPGLVHSETYAKLGAGAASFTSNLPVVVLNNFNGGRPDSDKEMAWTLYTPDAATGNRTSLSNPPVIATRGRMVVRGSSSAGWPKYSMNIEAWDESNEDTDVAPLGMAPEADWILGSFYGTDRAMIRNPFMYEMSNRMGRYATRTKFVEVFANTNDGTVDYPGDYLGVYALMEKPERGADRIPVEKLNPNDSTGNKVTGGYIIRVDRVEPGTTGWVTNRNFPLSEVAGSVGRLVYDYPSEEPAPLPSIPAAQSAYIRNHVQEFEDAVVQPNRTNPTTGKHYTDYIDRDAWVDHGLLNILSSNVDGLRLSTFMHKPRGGKLIAGPIWDFDLSLGIGNPLNWSSTGGDSTDLLNWGWWKYLYPDPDFWQRFTDRWSQVRGGPLSDASIAALMSQYQNELNEAAVRNFAKWPSVGPRDGPDAGSDATYSDEFDIMRTWLEQHTAWMDTQFIPKPVLASGAGNSVILTASQGTIYYTLNGSDPRLSGGGISPAASTLASGASITVTQGSLLTARAKSSALWSAPATGYYFAATPAAAGNIMVTELHYHPNDPSPSEQTAGFTNSDDFEFIELMNISAASVDLAGSRFTAGIDFTFPSNLVLAPGQRTIVVSNRGAFAARYPTVPSASIAGEYLNDQFNNDGEFVRLESASGAEVFSFTYGTDGLWPAESDGAGRSLVLSRPGSSPDANSPLSWHASPTFGGSPLFTETIGYEAWKSAAGITSDTQDTDGDGLLPLIEYSTGSDPETPDLTALPTLQKSPGGDWRVTLTRALAAEDIDFTIQVSENLTNFNDVPFIIETRSAASGSETLTCRLTDPPGGPQNFVRVRWFTRP